MSNSTRAFALGALLAVLPAAAPALAQGAAIMPPPPYHHDGNSGHGPVQTAHWPSGDADRHRHGLQPQYRWAPPHDRPQHAVRPLPPREIVRLLRRQHVQPIGRITLRHGVYWVPVLDHRGRQVLLLVDPATAAILGRQRRH